MFSKKTCKNCGKKIGNKENFCANCGAPIKIDEKEWGMLGKDDLNMNNQENLNPFANSMFGGIGGKVFNKMLNSAMKMLEKEMQNANKDFQNMNPNNKNNPHNFPKTNFELFINGKRINPENIKITQKPVKFIKDQNGRNNQSERPKQAKNIFLSEKKAKEFSTLPKKEPRTNIRRLSNKMIYEIEIPGVKTIDSISIVKMENSIEIKAVAKDNSYFKIIPLNLDISQFSLENEKLVLELKEN